VVGNCDVRVCMNVCIRGSEEEDEDEDEDEEEFV